MLRLLASLLPLALAVLSVLLYVSDLRARRPVEAAVRKFSVDVRRPLDVEMIRYAPVSDIGTQVFAMAAVSDALGRVRLKSLSPAERKAWLDVMTRLNDELDAARDMELDGIARRPGWPMHRYLLGKVVYTRDRRSFGAAVDPRRWLLPLGSAFASAPGNDPVAETLASVILEAWSYVSKQAPAPGSPEVANPAIPQSRNPAISQSSSLHVLTVFRRAFLDPDFVSRALAVTANAVGTQTAYSIVPDSAAPLRSATRVAVASGDVAGAWGLYGRWETAEWNERVSDLEAMKLRRAHGDWRGLLAASSSWGSRHAVGDFDSAAARAQVAEVLELWPKDAGGTWSGDPRAGMVRYFLAGRESSIGGATLLRTVNALADVPEPVEAQVLLAAGQVDAAERIATRSVTAGAFEWTDYLVDLARFHLKRNATNAVVDALVRISPSARGGCDVALLTGQVSHDPSVAPAFATTGPDGAIIPEAWSVNGMLSVCIDRATLSTKRLVVDVETAGPAIVAWGWNDARSASLLVGSGAATLRVPLAGLEGRNALFVRSIHGGKITSRSARVE